MIGPHSWLGVWDPIFSLKNPVFSMFLPFLPILNLWYRIKNVFFSVTGSRALDCMSKREKRKILDWYMAKWSSKWRFFLYKSSIYTILYIEYTIYSTCNYLAFGQIVAGTFKDLSRIIKHWTVTNLKPWITLF